MIEYLDCSRHIQSRRCSYEKSLFMKQKECLYSTERKQELCLEKHNTQGTFTKVLQFTETFSLHLASLNFTLLIWSAKQNWGRCCNFPGEKEVNGWVPWWLEDTPPTIFSRPALVRMQGWSVTYVGLMNKLLVPAVSPRVFPRVLRFSTLHQNATFPNINSFSIPYEHA